MKKVLIGFVAWDFVAQKPALGTRRFKVWTTEKEAASHLQKSDRYGVKPVFAEVPDEG